MACSFAFLVSQSDEADIAVSTQEARCSVAEDTCMIQALVERDVGGYAELHSVGYVGNHAFVEWIRS